MTSGRQSGFSETPGSPAPVQAAAPDDEDALRQEIERTREQLGETVGQLAAKADVKARTQARARDAAATGARVVRRQRVPLMAAATLIAVGILALRRRAKR
ncbi:MAG TPA: DUF3618 domain-containing protein [Streptosporangiaceae bacterium]